MSLYRVFVDQSPWATVVVRATDDTEAVGLGQDIASEYTGTRDGITVERLEPDGPAGPLIVDWS